MSLTEAEIKDKLTVVLEKRKKGKLEPLTPGKLRKRPGLENLTDEEAYGAIDTIKKLAAIFFEIHSLNEKRDGTKER